LHEIGTRISHENAHKHGAYIVKNANITGFSIPELERLSMLVMGHRGKLKKLEYALGDPTFVMQLVCLRLAVVLCHARVDPHLSGIRLSKQHHDILLHTPDSWASTHPQSMYLIEEESQAWKRSGLTWRLKTV
jgi:exopolyphosphatase/guanosine-5'-triphosphate,3'-diphosphate pyrophosphatase